MGALLSRPLVSAVGVFYPAYASFKALESPKDDDDKQWLTYWVVYAITTSVEEAAETVLAFFPGYYVLKCLFLVWLMLPKTRGAAIIYTSVLRPLLKKYEPLLDAKLVEMRQVVDKYFDDLKARTRDALHETSLPKLL
ncbi:Aste57867_22340 [Aphanomyces stellatus]|uniref:Aste57867_22340 protein n=1 Tax=Aphanomyces stellatus TaxID=120398 RepID=A0A485LKP2_9STRA|nr:hypothetical protein As57867_022270 [Aphanomyces stellatus]VFT99003.1 Aste57867_22340 [Aphanomyces stellatus]